MSGRNLTTRAWIPSITLALTLIASACAQSMSSSDDSRSIATATRSVGNPGAGHGDMTYYFDETAVVSHIAAAPNDAWAHVLTAYQEMGLEPDIQSATDLMVGVREVTLRRTLGERRISSYLNCGRDMTGELADRSTVRLSILTRLLPSAEGGTRIRTELMANATDNDGTSRTVRPCSSNNRLEMALAEHIADRVTPGG